MASSRPRRRGLKGELGLRKEPPEMITILFEMADSDWLKWWIGNVIGNCIGGDQNAPLSNHNTRSPSSPLSYILKCWNRIRILASNYLCMYTLLKLTKAGIYTLLTHTKQSHSTSIYSAFSSIDSIMAASQGIDVHKNIYLFVLFWPVSGQGYIWQTRWRCLFICRQDTEQSSASWLFMTRY